MSEANTLSNSAAAFKDARKLARQFGAEEALGGDASVKFGLALIQLAHNGIIDEEKVHADPSGAKDPETGAAKAVDAVTVLFHDYLEANSKKAQFTEGGRRANLSKARQLVKAGMIADTVCDPVMESDRLIRARKALLANGQKVRPTYHVLVDWARTQLGSDTVLTDSAIEDLCRPNVKADPEFAKEIKKMADLVEKIIAGEAKVTAPNDDIKSALIDVHTTFKGMLAMLTMADELAAIQAVAAKYGVTLARAQ